MERRALLFWFGLGWLLSYQITRDVQNSCLKTGDVERLGI